MRWSRSIRVLVAAVAVAFGAASALAQQVTTYGITNVTAGSLIEARPSNAVNTGLNGDDSYTTVSLPFTFTYFGTNYTNCYPSTNGLLGLASGSTTYSNPTLGSSSTFNGYLMLYWDDLAVGSSYYGGNVFYWTTGSQPNRKFVVSWEGVYTLGGSGPFTFQAQLLETTGSMYFSYGSGSWPSSSYTQGIQGPSGQWQAPQSNSNALSGRPPYDVKFDNFRVTFTGRALYDRYIVDPSGVGNSSEMNIPLAGMNVEARNANNATVGVATTDGAGYFSLAAVGVPTSEIGRIVITSGSPAANVRASANGPLFAATLLSNVAFAQDADVGTLTLRESNDSGGVQRAPINIVRAMASVYNWARLRTTESISTVDPVIYDVTSTAGNSYVAKNGTTPASMVVSGPLGTFDAWDVSVLRTMYGRHVLASIAADAGTAYDGTFDKATNDNNAFAEGFGHYMNVMTSGDAKFYDATGVSTVTVIDYENPTMTTSMASNVAGWVAAALYDLADPANESWDTVNGAGAVGEQVFQTVASMSTAVTSASFFNAWVTRGYDATSLARNFIHYNLIADDPDEPNDFLSEATQVNQFGFIKSSHVLNAYNEDHYRFTMADSTDAITASVVYDRTRYPNVSLRLEVMDNAGNVLVTGAALPNDGGVGPIVARTGALDPGDYRVRMALNTAVPLPDYKLQVFSALAFKSGEFEPWTLNRPINVPVNIKGGVPPYNLTVLSPFKKPDGLILDGQNGRVVGSPTGPQFPEAPIPLGGSFTYSFLLSAQDVATPPNTASGTVAFTVNDFMRTQAEEFVAFPWNKSVLRDAPFTGGTAPFDSAVTAGALPNGLVVETDPRLRFSGTPDTPGSSPLDLNAVDRAGSAVTASTNAVVCVPFGTTNLALGASACGYYFDALEGTSVSLAISTVKKQPVRLLRVQILDSDGFTDIPARVKVGKGRAAVTSFIAPHTGRFYCIVASDSGDATRLTCVGKVLLPKALTGNNGTKAIVPGSSPFVINIGALSGAVLNLTTKPDKSGLQLTVYYLIDPSGEYRGELAADLKAKAGGFTLTKTLDVTGTWKVLVVALPGPQGNFTYSVKLKQPKGVSYTVD